MTTETETPDAKATLYDAMRTLKVRSGMFSVVATPGVTTLPEREQQWVVEAVVSYSYGTAEQVAAGEVNAEHGGEDSDPWSEHDFGAFEVAGERYFWQWDDYGDDHASYGVPNRYVLTIMRADEY